MTPVKAESGNLLLDLTKLLLVKKLDFIHQIHQIEKKLAEKTKLSFSKSVPRLLKELEIYGLDSRLPARI